MKIIILSFVILFLPLRDTFAQNRLFRTYRSHCSKSFNIDLTKPKKFKVIDGMTIFRVNEKMTIASFYQMVLESEDKDCLILYPHFGALPNHPLAVKNMTYGEVEAALNIYSDNKRPRQPVNGMFMIQGVSDSNSNNETVKLDTAKYVRIIAEDDMRDYFNADTVYVIKVRLPKPYKEVYSECIGINAMKKGYPTAMMKILLTEAGKRKEEEYMQVLFDNIHYPDVVPKHNQEK